MHMEKAYLTTTNYSGKGKRSPNTAAARKAKADHDAWLRKQGLHPEQRALAKAIKGVHRNALPDLTVESRYELSNNIKVDGGYQKGIMTKLRDESPETQKEILAKAARTAPAFSKGAYQYITPGADLSDLGRKK